MDAFAMKEKATEASTFPITPELVAAANRAAAEPAHHITRSEMRDRLLTLTNQQGEAQHAPNKPRA